MADWESIFREKGIVFEENQEDMKNIISLLKKENVKRVLDLGCGSGRHTILLAKAGFDVYATDISNEGLRLTNIALKHNKLNAKLVNASCYEKFPFKDNFFDAVISTQVIHHNFHEKVNYCISEIVRVLKPNGIIFITVSARKFKGRATKFKVADLNTYVMLDGDEKGLPHFIYSKKLLYEDFNSFEILDIHIDKGQHWCLLGKKKMNKIKTRSFELAVYIRGNPNAKKLALLLPGRLDTKDYAHMKSHVDYFANNGYLALSFDPPGTWESLGSIKQYTMTNYLRAIDEIIKNFGNRPTILMGHSRGGTMAMLAGVKNKFVTHIIAVMSRPGPSTLTDKTRKIGFEISYRDTPSGGKVKFELPVSYFENALKYDVMKGLTKCKKPKLFFYGNKDKIISPNSVKEAYDKSEEPKELIELNSDHDYRFHPEIIKKVNVAVKKFLNFY